MPDASLLMMAWLGIGAVGLSAGAVGVRLTRRRLLHDEVLLDQHHEEDVRELQPAA